MKVLILSCNMGGGHNSSANALRNILLKRGFECDMEDYLAIISKSLSKNLRDFYFFSTKRRFIFNVIYKTGEFISNTNRRLFSGHLKSLLYTTNKICSGKVFDKISKGGYDAVISTHIFPAEALTSFRRDKCMNIPTLFIMTDYTCIPFSNETECDAYAIAHKHLIDECISRGIPPAKLHPTGIPIDEERFAGRISRTEARIKANDAFGWGDMNDDSNWFLIMGGLMGFGDIEHLVKHLLHKTGQNARIICICAENGKLKSLLTRKFSSDTSVKILDYTDQIPLLMSACDVLLTKPGGVTSTEAAIHNIPLVHTSPIPGQEDPNIIFFRDHGMSLFSNDTHEQADLALLLCTNATLRDRMLTAQRETINHHVCEQIADLITSMIKKIDRHPTGCQPTINK